MFCSQASGFYQSLACPMAREFFGTTFEENILVKDYCKRSNSLFQSQFLINCLTTSIYLIVHLSTVTAGEKILCGGRGGCAEFKEPPANDIVILSHLNLCKITHSLVALCFVRYVCNHG